MGTPEPGRPRCGRPTGASLPPPRGPGRGPQPARRDASL